MHHVEIDEKIEMALDRGPIHIRKMIGEHKQDTERAAYSSHSPKTSDNPISKWPHFIRRWV